MQLDCGGEMAAGADTYSPLIVVPGSPQVRNEGCWLDG
jgi:hypothetical protein